MKLLEIIKGIAQSLSKENCLYCLVGGHAASLYRAQERFTRDVDFALFTEKTSASEQIASNAIKSIGFEPIAALIPTRKGEKRKNICMVTAAPLKGELKGIVDILLPELPWVANATARAQHNKIELGFAEIPLIPPEDLIVAKCYALNNAPDRFQDLDDLKEIFLNIKDLDFDYIRESLRSLEVSIPKAVKKYYLGGKLS